MDANKARLREPHMSFRGILHAIPEPHMSFQNLACHAQPSDVHFT
jgi:hypothetical protein